MPDEGLIAAKRARALGDERRLMPLAEPHWPSTEKQAWGMVVVSGELHPHAFGYRLSRPGGASFVLATQVLADG